MKKTMTAIARLSQVPRLVRACLSDALYRGSLYLLANTVTTSAIGFVFWALAAHRYSASAVGTFSGITSGAILLATIAALGLPITMTRHIATAEDARGLVFVAITVIATVGTVLCLVAVLLLGPHLPSALHIQQRGSMALLVTILVIFTALGSAMDAGLVATRKTRFLLIKNLIGSIIKLAAMPLLSSFRSTGLLISFVLGLVIATLLSGAALSRHLISKRIKLRTFNLPWHYLSNISANYLATVIGILPITVVPIEVLAIRGAAQTAVFSVAFLIAGFLNFIPSTTGQVLFAEIARGGTPLGRQFRKALRAVYGLLLPSMAIVFIAAPYILRLFGHAYEAEAAMCLRVLSLSALPAGGTYLVDSLLIARDRTFAYTFMQFSNAILVLGSVGILLPRGLAAAAGGWDFAQCLTLVLGLIVLATGRPGRHHLRANTPMSVHVNQSQRHEKESQTIFYSSEPQIRELLAKWPEMPTSLIAKRIGWEGSFQSLLHHVTELRSSFSSLDQRAGQASYAARGTAQCGFWFPPIEIPVGFGQKRSAKHLPVLTMITCDSQWLSAVLIPSRRAEDLFAGLWQLMIELGAVPRTLIWQSEEAVGGWYHGQPKITAACSRFCRSLNTTVVMCRTGEPATTSVMRRSQSYLERTFIRARTFDSPDNFNLQLRNWLAVDNARRHQAKSYSPAALMATDRKAMLPLPPIPPATGWRIRIRVTEHPFIRFDSNDYSIPPALIGRAVELVADLSKIRVLYDGKLSAEHRRAWTREQTIRKEPNGTATRIIRR